VCKGNPVDRKDEFQFTSCHLNLPTIDNYDTSIPRVMLLREDGELATTEVTFVDDIHVAGRAKEGEFNYAKSGCKQLKSRMNSLGNQGAERKFRNLSPWPGVWNGLIIHTGTPFPMKSTTGKKWDKFKKGLRRILEAEEAGHRMINTLDIRKVAGLGVNVTEVYPNGRCFLKGFFNAVEAWRGDRDMDGWRLTDLMSEVSHLESNDAGDIEFSAGYPISTHLTDELISHARALLELFVSDLLLTDFHL